MRVSVVIPSYNHSDYVAQAIESVLDQSWPDVDLIVIDDGSTDGSPEIIGELHDRRGGFRFVARENRGLIKTLNQGLAMAEGEFFCEIASDDYFPLDSIERRARFLVEHPDHVAVFGDGSLVEKGEPTGATFNIDRTRRALEKNDPIPDMLRGGKPVFCTGLIRTDVLRRIAGFDDETFRFYEDLDTPIRIALEGSLGLLEEPVIFRRHHETNVSATTPHIRLEKALFFSKMLKDRRMLPYRRLLHKLFRRSLLALGRCAQDQGIQVLRQTSIFREGWVYVLRDVRLTPYLIRWGL